MIMLPKLPYRNNDDAKDGIGNEIPGTKIEGVGGFLGTGNFLLNHSIDGRGPYRENHK